MSDYKKGQGLIRYIFNEQMIYAGGVRWRSNDRRYGLGNTQLSDVRLEAVYKRVEVKVNKRQKINKKTFAILRI